MLVLEVFWGSQRPSDQWPYGDLNNKLLNKRAFTRHKKHPNSEYFLVGIFPYSVWMQRITYKCKCKCPYSVQIRENTDQKKLWIQTIITSINVIDTDRFLWASKRLRVELKPSKSEICSLEVDVLLTQWRVYNVHDRGSHYIETSPLICSANQWTGFYMTGTAVMKELKC